MFILYISQRTKEMCTQSCNNTCTTHTHIRDCIPQLVNPNTPHHFISPVAFDSHTAPNIVMVVPNNAKTIPNNMNKHPLQGIPNVYNMHAGKINCNDAPAVDPIKEMTKPMSKPSHLIAKARANMVNCMAMVVRMYDFPPCSISPTNSNNVCRAMYNMVG